LPYISSYNSQQNFCLRALERVRVFPAAYPLTPSRTAADEQPQDKPAYKQNIAPCNRKPAAWQHIHLHAKAIKAYGQDGKKEGGAPIRFAMKKPLLESMLHSLLRIVQSLKPKKQKPNGAIITARPTTTKKPPVIRELW
jgi:hypothetical protein